MVAGFQTERIQSEACQTWRSYEIPVPGKTRAAARSLVETDKPACDGDQAKGLPVEGCFEGSKGGTKTETELSA